MIEHGVQASGKSKYPSPVLKCQNSTYCASVLDGNMSMETMRVCSLKYQIALYKKALCVITQLYGVNSIKIGPEMTSGYFFLNCLIPSIVHVCKHQSRIHNCTPCFNSLFRLQF